MSTAIQSSQRQHAGLQTPRAYRVMLHNDDYTPMDFVVQILQKFFGHGLEKAQLTMMKVHTEGKAVCGIYSRDVAQTKVQQVLDCAREHQYPLQCSCEPDEQ